MAYKIVWTKIAEKQFEMIVRYIEREWSIRISSRFIERTNEILDLLSIYPEAGSVEIKRKKIRGFLISKQVRLFYRITKNSLLLLGFFDTRLNPAKKLSRYK